MTDGSPDLGARLRALDGCRQAPYWHQRAAINGACDKCLAILVAAIRAETLEEAAKACEVEAAIWEGEEGPATGKFAAEARLCAFRVRALTGSQTPNG